MGFVMINKIYKLFIKNLFDIKGRASRKEYIVRSLMTMFLYIISQYVYRVSDLINHFLLDIISIILSVLFVIYVIQVFFLNLRRLHDFNASGWWQLLIPFIPFIICIVTWRGSIAISQSLILVMPFLLLLPYLLFIPLSIIKGTLSANKYGEPPIN